MSEADDPSADLETVPIPDGDVVLAGRRGRQCGKKRWAVKTLSDSAVNEIDFDTVVPTTIGKVNQFAQRCSGLSEERQGKREFQVFQVRGPLAIHSRGESSRKTNRCASLNCDLMSRRNRTTGTA